MDVDENILWISGGIDVNGQVIGHAAHNDNSSSLMHTAEEMAHCSFRWCPHDKKFMQHFRRQPRKMTKDEFFAVEDWLIRHGYAEDSDFSS